MPIQNDKVVKDQYNSSFLNQADLSVFPNPTKDVVTIVINKHDFEIPVRIEIYSLQGKRIINEQLTQPRSEIDLSQFESGVYIARVVIDERVEEIRIVKQ